MNLLQKERNELTLQEIACKVGETPPKIAVSLLRLFLQNEKLQNEKLFKFHSKTFYICYMVLLVSWLSEIIV